MHVLYRTVCMYYITVCMYYKLCQRYYSRNIFMHDHKINPSQFHMISISKKEIENDRISEHGEDGCESG